MVSAQRNRGASDILYSYCYSYSTVDVTPTSTPRAKKAFNGQRHNGKYVSISTGVLSYSIHIQFFSQNQSLLSSIQNQMIIKRVERIKLNNAGGGTTTIMAMTRRRCRRRTRMDTTSRTRMMISMYLCR